MQFFIIVLIISFVIFLFSLYSFAHDDFVLLRRNVSTDNVFNYAFSIALVALLFSRIFYVLFHPKPIFLNPLGFILFPYFPGLSMLGGVVGGILFLALLFRKKGFPLGRVFDFISSSFLSAIPFGFVGYILLSKDHTIPTLIALLIYTILFVLLIFLIQPRLSKNGKSDGIMGLIFLISFSLISIGHNFLTHLQHNLLAVNYVILFIILIASLVLLTRQVLKSKLIFKK